MRPWITAVLIIGVLFAGNALAVEDGLGLFFSSTEFSMETAVIDVVPGFMMTGYIVLTDPSGAVIDGYEVGITCSAEDFEIPMTNLTFDINAGTNLNQIITFMVPKPAVAAGTILATIFFTTESIDLETIVFGASTPASLPVDQPVVDYGAGGLVAADHPFCTSIVAWLNEQPVPIEGSTWGAVKATFK
jgi:hypothetical protein